MMILWPGWLLIRKYGGLVCSQAHAWRPGLRKSAGVLLHAACLIHTHMCTQIHRPPEAHRERMISSWLIFSIEVDLCMSDATPPPVTLKYGSPDNVQVRHSHPQTRLHAKPLHQMLPTALHVDSYTLNI